MVSGKSPEVRFAKTKMCKFNIQGKCAKGTNCSFAHGPDEMEVSPDLFRTQLCMALFKTGKCKDGESCKYAHVREQLRALPGSHPMAADKATYGPTKGRLTTQKQQGQIKSGNADHGSPKPQPQRLTPPSSPNHPPIAPGIWMAAVPIPVLGLPAGMDVTADGQLIMSNPGSICNSPINGPIAGVIPNFGLPFGMAPTAMYNLPYTPCEEPALGTPPMRERIPSDHMLAEQVKLPGPFECLNIQEKEPDIDFILGSMLTESMSESSTDGSDRDKSSADGDSYDSMGSSIYSLPVPAFEQGFEVSIKNTFLDVTPKTPTKRFSQSVPRKLSGSFMLTTP